MLPAEIMPRLNSLTFLSINVGVLWRIKPCKSKDVFVFQRRPHKIESMFWFQNFSYLYGRVNKTRIVKETQASFIIWKTYNLVILVKWKTLWKSNVLKLDEKTIPRLFMCKQFSWSFNFHKKIDLYGKKCTNFNGFRENVCVCFSWNPKQLYARAESKHTFNFKRPAHFPWKVSTPIKLHSNLLAPPTRTSLAVHSAPLVYCMSAVLSSRKSVCFQIPLFTPHLSG